MAGFIAAPESPDGSCCSFEDGSSSGDLFQIRRLEILREIQKLVDRYNDCFTSLHQANADVKLLRCKNLDLTAENLRLTFLVDEAIDAFEAELSLSSSAAFPAGIGAKSESDQGPPPPPNTIPIRSLEISPAVGENPESHRLRLPATATIQEDGTVEVEVYQQGTVKTELCNKWELKGLCPYGDRCQFAHGVHELKPVIRHPRYKTQLCRMVGTCPYGHRCHFRHTAQ